MRDGSIGFEEGGQRKMAMQQCFLVMIGSMFCIFELEATF